MHIYRYLPNYESLVEQLVKLYIYAAVPSVLLIDDLDNYLNDEAIQNNLNERISKICALILHSMKSCSRVLEMNVSEKCCVYNERKSLFFFLRTNLFLRTFIIRFVLRENRNYCLLHATCKLLFKKLI